MPRLHSVVVALSFTNSTFFTTEDAEGAEKHLRVLRGAEPPGTGAPQAALVGLA